MKTGIELIAEERKEQIEKHGRTIEKDAEQNDLCELKVGAIAMLELDEQEHDFVSLGGFPSGWNLDICAKMAHKPYKERLIIAGALIAAEIDRLQFNSLISTENEQA